MSMNKLLGAGKTHYSWKRAEQLFLPAMLYYHTMPRNVATPGLATSRGEKQQILQAGRASYRSVRTLNWVDGKGGEARRPLYRSCISFKTVSLWILRNPLLYGRVCRNVCLQMVDWVLQNE